MSKIKLLLISTLFVLLAGCASQDVPDPEPTDETYGSEDGADTAGMDGSGFGEGEFIDDDLAGGELADVVFFDFDSYELRPDDADVAARHGIQLADNPGRNVRLEGHADERGSREYNIGLGERRAQAVRQALMSLRVPSTRLATVSFGEERPAVFGQDDASLAANRRVEIVYGR